MELTALINHYKDTFPDSGHNLEQHKILLTYNSTTLEGCTLSLVEMELLLKDNVTPLGKPLEHSLMVKDHYQALRYVLEEAMAKRPITEETIQTISALLREHTGSIRQTMSGTFDERKGEYRLLSTFANVLQQDGSVKSIYYPDCTKVPAMMKELCQYINKTIDTLTNPQDRYNFSFDCHYHLRRIHPFSDGNSRASRLLMNYVQQYYEIPLTSVNVLHRQDYINAFYQSSKENTQPFRDFLMQEATDFLSSMMIKK